MKFSDLEISPGLWALSAQRLKRGGDLIFEAYLKDLHDLSNGVSPIDLMNLELAGAGTMLYGLAIENLLKGLIIKTIGKPQKWPGLAHDQNELSKILTLIFSSEEKNLFTRFTSFVRWAGKYKVPNKESEMCIDNSLPYPLQESELKLFNQLFEKLMAQIISD